jgi:hypothetical protein
MTYAHGNELKSDNGETLATFKTHWQAVAAMLHLSNPGFASLGGDTLEALEIEKTINQPRS